MNELIIYHSLDGDVHVITRASMSKAPQKIKFVIIFESINHTPKRTKVIPVGGQYRTAYISKSQPFSFSVIE